MQNITASVSTYLIAMKQFSSSELHELIRHLDLLFVSKKMMSIRPKYVMKMQRVPLKFWSLTLLKIKKYQKSDLIDSGKIKMMLVLCNIITKYKLYYYNNVFLYDSQSHSKFLHILNTHVSYIENIHFKTFVYQL